MWKNNFVYCQIFLLVAVNCCFKIVHFTNISNGFKISVKLTHVPLREDVTSISIRWSTKFFLLKCNKLFFHTISFRFRNKYLFFVLGGLGNIKLSSWSVHNEKYWLSKNLIEKMYKNFHMKKKIITIHIFMAYVCLVFEIIFRQVEGENPR